MTEVTSQERKQKSNPFHGDKENFPSLENFFSSPPCSPQEPPTTEADDDEGETSLLNLSIGAFAALAEHMRHVAKYGIDNEFAPQEEEEEVEFTATTNPLDAQWDYILDHSNVHPDNSFFAAHNTSVDASLSNASTDYFNSSQVDALATPERNKNTPAMVWKRGQEPFYDEDEEEDLENDDHAPPEVLAKQYQDLLNISKISNVTPNHSSFYVPDDDLDFLNLSSAPDVDYSFSSSPMKDNNNNKENFFAAIAKTTTPIKQSMHKSLENLPRDFMNALGKYKENGTPSPIPSKQSTPSPPIHQRNQNEITPPSSLSGRRKYRTVVPRRVFLEEKDPNYLQEQQDSFSVSEEKKVPSPLKKSLRESFEKALHHASPLFGASSSS